MTEIRLLKDEDGTPGLETDERLALLAVCVVSQQRAGFKDVIDLRENKCPDCSAPGFNTGWGAWQFTCGAERLTDDECTVGEPCPKSGEGRVAQKAAMADAFTHAEYRELYERLMAAEDDDVTAILSNNFNVVLGALHAAAWWRPISELKTEGRVIVCGNTHSAGEHYPVIARAIFTDDQAKIIWVGLGLDFDPKYFIPIEALPPNPSAH